MPEKLLRLAKITPTCTYPFPETFDGSNDNEKSGPELAVAVFAKRGMAVSARRRRANSRFGVLTKEVLPIF